MRVLRPVILIIALLTGHTFTQRAPSRDAARNKIPSTDEWYLPTEDKAAQLYVYEIGRGKPVVVLHGGFGAEYSYLLDAVGGLVNKYHFVFYDQRGSLRSPCKVEQISFDKHVEDLETLRKALGLEKMTLFAHSMGTLLAIGYLQKYPAHVKNMVLAGALPLKSGRYFNPAYISAWQTAHDAAASFPDRAEVKAELAKVGYGQPNLTPKQRSEIARIKFASASIYHIDRWREAKGWGIYFNEAAGQAAASSLFKRLTNDYDFTPVIENHPYPITVISGDHDYVDFGNAFFKLYSKEVKKLDLIVIRDAGHNAWIDDPVNFRLALDAGLSKRLKQ